MLCLSNWDETQQSGMIVDSCTFVLLEKGRMLGFVSKDADYKDYPELI